MNRQVWVLNDDGHTIRGPFFFKEKKGGWVRFKDAKWCARPHQIHDSYEDALKEIIRLLGYRIEALENTRSKLQKSLNALEADHE